MQLMVQVFWSNGDREEVPLYRVYGLSRCDRNGNREQPAVLVTDYPIEAMDSIAKKNALRMELQLLNVYIRPGALR